MSIFDNVPVLTASSRNESVLTSSGDSTASRKRKRETSRRSPSPTAPGFSSSTLRWLLSTYKECWLCGAEPLDACHVVARADVEWRDFRRLGLLSINNLDDVANAIVLCPNCHRVYDRTPPSPGFVFFPQDVQWFMRCEEADYERRKILREANKHRTVRIPPTAQQYMDYQQEEQSSVEDALGGSYSRCILRDYFPRKIPGQGPVQPGPISPAIWHGDPMASLKRTFAVLANPMIRGIPHEVRRQLLELSALYSAHDEDDERLAGEDQADDDAQRSGDDREKGQGTDEGPKHKEDQESHHDAEDRGSRVQQSSATAFEGAIERKQGMDPMISINGGPLRSRCITSHSEDSGIALEPLISTAVEWRRQKRNASVERSNEERSGHAWEWGPMATAEDAMQHFARVTRIRYQIADALH